MIQTGLARLVADGASILEGRRLGLLCNPTAIDGEFRHAVDLLSTRPDLTVTALFGPEHGVRGDAQDMISVDGARDRSGLPVHSLYGHTIDSLSPTPAMLEDIDVMVYDVQDVGSRYYTFVWTMVLASVLLALETVETVGPDAPALNKTMPARVYSAAL